jgi:hypothetical protein
MHAIVSVELLALRGLFALKHGTTPGSDEARESDDD